MTVHDPFSQLAAKAPLPRDAVLDSIRAELRDDSTPKRSLTRQQRVIFSAGALSLGLLLTTMRAFLHSPETVVLAAAAVSLSIGGLLLGGLVPGGRRAMGLSLRQALVALICVAVFSVLAFQAESFAPFTEFLHADSMHRAGACAGHSLLSGVVGSTLLLFLWRKTDPFSPGLTGCLLGLLGGVIGTTSVGLICKSSEGLHLTLAHGASLIVLGLVGVFLGRKWLTP